MHSEAAPRNDNEETSEAGASVRAGVEAADDTGMIAQQEFLHVVGDAETGGDDRATEGSGEERA